MFFHVPTTGNHGTCQHGRVFFLRLGTLFEVGFPFSEKIKRVPILRRDDISHMGKARVKTCYVALNGIWVWLKMNQEGQTAGSEVHVSTLTRATHFGNSVFLFLPPPYRSRLLRTRIRGLPSIQALRSPALQAGGFWALSPGSSERVRYMAPGIGLYFL